MSATALRARAWRDHTPVRPEAVADAHRCPVTNCWALVSPGHIACRQHWTAVPISHRKTLVAAFQRREREPERFARAVRAGRMLVLHYSRGAA